MPGYEDAVRIAAELFRILVNPGDGALQLIGDRIKAVANVLYPAEVRHDVMDTRFDKQVGEERVCRSGSLLPGATVDEDVNGRVGSVGLKHIQRLNVLVAI